MDWKMKICFEKPAFKNQKTLLVKTPIWLHLWLYGFLNRCECLYDWINDLRRG